MKRGQATLEYVLLCVFFAIVCMFVAQLWNRYAIIQGSSFGVVDQNDNVHVRPMTE